MTTQPTSSQLTKQRNMSSLPQLRLEHTGFIDCISPYVTNLPEKDSNLYILGSVKNEQHLIN